MTRIAAPLPFSEADRRPPISSVKIEVFDNQIEPALKAPLTSLIDRAFTWSAFDRWHALFTAHGAFPARRHGLHVVPASKAPPAVRVAYRQRKVDLFLEWLDMRVPQTSELGRYTKQGMRVRIVRQEDGHRCPACESFNAHEVRLGSDTMLPLHPGCRCVRMAMIPVAPRERFGTHPRHRSRLSS